jgi:hypothetical protein
MRRGTGLLVLRRASPALAAIAACFATPTLNAQAPPELVPEFRVNTYTTASQSYPQVAQASTGDFLVVWAKSATNDISSQRYTSAGVPVGGEERVNTSLGGVHAAPSVAFSPTGEALAAWSDGGGHDGNGFGILARRFDAGGTAIGSDFVVNTHTTGAQLTPFVAFGGDGHAIVVWTSGAEDGDSNGVFGQRYDGSGAAIGGEFRANSTTAGSQVAAGVAANAAGEFVVVWTGPDGASSGIFAQRFASSGAALGAETLVNGITAGAQASPSVTMDTAGAFVVAWQSGGVDGNGYGIAARRFASSGAAIGSQFTVNTYVAGDQKRPQITGDSTGNFLVVWQSPHDGSGNGVYGRTYGSAGNAVGSEFLVNASTSNDQGYASAALGRNLIVTWQSSQQDGSDTGIYARVFAGSCLAGDVDGNGAVNVADVFYLINALFASGPAPVCSGNVNGDAASDVSDVFYLINYLFASGPPPV